MTAFLGYETPVRGSKVERYYLTYKRGETWMCLSDERDEIRAWPGRPAEVAWKENGMKLGFESSILAHSCELQEFKVKLLLVLAAHFIAHA